MHMVTTPNLALRRCISLAMVPTIREPVMPNGWPMAIEPPLTFRFRVNGQPNRVVLSRVIHTTENAGSVTDESQKRGIGAVGDAVTIVVSGPILARSSQSPRAAFG